jgi:hypothetical protein
MRKPYSLKWVLPMTAIVVVVLAMLIGLPHVQSRSVSMQVDPTAEQLGKMLQKLTEEYRAKDADAAPHRHIIAEEEAKLAPIQSSMDKIAEGAAGLDHTLCKLYGVRYVRAPDGSIGTYKSVEADECDPLQ